MSKATNPMDGLPVIHERAAGIGIGSRFHLVAVPTAPWLMGPYGHSKRLRLISSGWPIG